MSFSAKLRLSHFDSDNILDVQLMEHEIFMCPEASLEEGSVTSVKSKLKVSKTISYKTIFRVFTESKQ